LHLDKGNIMRIQPNHVSVADDSAIQIIYGHGNLVIKSWDALPNSIFMFIALFYICMNCLSISLLALL
jgi:hypothetical protein